MISTYNLKYKYAGGDEIVFPDIKCEGKDMLLVLGNSGVGKTTLLHLLSGILKIQTGSVKIKDTEIGNLDRGMLDDFRGKNIGIIFQQNHFVDSLNVIENIVLAQSLSGQQVDKDAAFDLLKRLNIPQKKNSNIRDLSQGEKQRVAIARALINKPKLILADEPTSALDDQNSEEVLTLLQEQAIVVGSALIIVTHDNRLKDKISNRVTLQ
jgi:putative ABC transport system ATP-binding protein